MGRTRYKIIEPKQPHFITCTILHWLPIFTRHSSVQIIIDCLNYLKNSDGLKLYGFVILENHLHLIISSENLPKTIQKFKSYTAKKLFKYSMPMDQILCLINLSFIKRCTRPILIFKFGK